MKLSTHQKSILIRLRKPYMDGEPNHPKDAYRENSIAKLKQLGLVETYFYRNFLHGAVRLTQLGVLEVSNHIVPTESAQGANATGGR